jgi:hypothetical protein
MLACRHEVAADHMRDEGKQSGSMKRERQTPAALTAIQKAEVEKWWPLIREFGIKAE